MFLYEQKLSSPKKSGYKNVASRWQLYYVINVNYPFCYILMRFPSSIWYTCILCGLTKLGNPFSKTGLENSLWKFISFFKRKTFETGKVGSTGVSLIWNYKVTKFQMKRSNDTLGN